ncbi:uncharacterized protein LOC123005147 [Tribolium madens]|uniref:uncharacterized protein LOC123005147 n=1 Tax=Tribolium madens TaxID=41895 RepID=UPI001CF7320A|nr:uncharacterized protein LOC123005147 [Tribolium madens]
MFLPIFINFLNFVGLPLQKPKTKLYSVYIFSVSALYVTLTGISLYSTLVIRFLASKTLNAFFYILIYVVINIIDLLATLQNGYFKRYSIDKLLITMEDLLGFVNRNVGRQTERKLIRMQKFDFILIQMTMIPWLIFMTYWVGHLVTFKKFMVFGMVYYNHYLTAMEVMKIFMILQLLKHLMCEHNRQLFKTLSTKQVLSEKELHSFLKHYDKLIDCVGLFNESFGLQILGTSIVTPLIMVQGIFFSLSQVSFPSVIRTVVVNVATLTKFTLFLVLSFMIAAPSQRIAREFQNTQRICNTFRSNTKHNKEVQRMLQLLSLQLQNRKTCISAAGFFDADYTMILNMLVSTVSYVIVFLQINAKIPN